jgi:hypothetical protein
MALPAKTMIFMGIDKDYADFCGITPQTAADQSDMPSAL